MRFPARRHRRARPGQPGGVGRQVAHPHVRGAARAGPGLGPASPWCWWTSAWCHATTRPATPPWWPATCCKAKAAAARFLRVLPRTRAAVQRRRAGRAGERRHRSHRRPALAAGRGRAGHGRRRHTASLFQAPPATPAPSPPTSAWPGWCPTPRPTRRICFTLHALLGRANWCCPSPVTTSWPSTAGRRHEADPALPVSLVLNQTRTPVSVWIG
jgi:hypothetical protein